MRSLVVALLGGMVVTAGCRAPNASVGDSPLDVRLRARDAFLASETTVGLLDRLGELGCEAGTWGLYRWPVGVTIDGGHAGASIVENVDCADHRHAEIVITAASTDASLSAFHVSGAAVVREPAGSGDALLLMADRDGLLREVPLTAEVSAEIERALADARVPTSDAAMESLLSADALDEVSGACRRAFRGFTAEDLASVIAGDIPTRGDCATCLSDVALCLGVVDRLSQVHDACMATLHCANQADSGRVRAALGDQPFGAFGADEIATWLGGATCAEITTTDDDLAYCANLYVQGGAAPRNWVHPVQAGCEGAFLGYGSPPGWMGDPTGCFSLPDAPVYWNEITHRGSDCGNAVGTEVRAIGPGRVMRFAANYPGDVVVVRHELTPAEASDLGITGRIDGRITLNSMYGHLQNVAVSDGQLVESGQRIGEIHPHYNGNHLHWETHTISDFTCRSPRGGYPNAYGPGYEWTSASGTRYPTLGSGDWFNPTATLTTLQTTAATGPTSAAASGFAGLETWLARAISSEGLTRAEITDALEGSTLFVPTEGALAGIFALTDLQAARDAGYFANFATLQRHRASYLGEGPGTQFYCATELDTLYSCHPPLCFGEPAGTTTDEVTSACFDVALSCSDPTASCPDTPSVDGCCPHLLTATLSPDLASLDFTRPVGGWTADAWSYWPAAAVPTNVTCEYVLAVDSPSGEGTYMPSAGVVRGAAAATTSCPPPP